MAANTAWPPDVELCSVQFGKGIGLDGTNLLATLTVEALFGGSTVSIHWDDPDSTAVMPTVVSTTSDAGTFGTVRLPVVDQDGWKDDGQNAFKMWAYRLTETVRDGFTTIRRTKYLQPLSGQTVVDFDTIGNGTVGVPVTAPSAVVQSVAGLTGTVSADDLATALGGVSSGGGTSTVDGITDATTVGKEILKASDAAAVLAITGAQPAGSYATSAQGALADTAVQPGSLAPVATSGAYSDLSGQPAIPSTAQDVGAVPTSRTVNGKPLSADVTLGAGDVGAQPAGAYATAAQGAKADTAVQPGTLAAVATSGAYSDLTGRPTLGTASGQDSTAFATAAQGTKADTAVQPAALAGFAVFNVESAGVYPSRPSTTGAVIWAGPDQPDPTFMVEGDFWLEESA